jgi:hypothetical protein
MGVLLLPAVLVAFEFELFAVLPKVISIIKDCVILIEIT